MGTDRELDWHNHWGTMADYEVPASRPWSDFGSGF